jgi:hypothetical protein
MLADGARALPSGRCLQLQALGCNGQVGIQRKPPANAVAAGTLTRKRSTEKCNHRPMERQTRRRQRAVTRCSAAVSAPSVNILAPVSANFKSTNTSWSFTQLLLAANLRVREKMLAIALLGSAWAVLACTPSPGLLAGPAPWQGLGTAVGACEGAFALGSRLPALQLRGGGRDGDGPLPAGGAEACPRWPVCGLHEVLWQVTV